MNILRRFLIVITLTVLYVIIGLIILFWIFLFIPITPIEYILFGTKNVINIPYKAMDNLEYSDNKLKEKILKAKRFKKELMK